MKNYYPLLQSIFVIVGFLTFFGSVQASDATNCVTEEAVFHIECPPDTTIDCNDELYDLSIYGQAYIYGYGDPEPAGPPVVHYNLNSCNIGTITRTWYAYDYSGNQYSCTQVITVLGAGGFNGNNINWPDDYQTSTCGAGLQPSNLPYPFNYPTFSNVGDCVDLMYSYDDLVFEINPPACIKILRKWTVIDWCSYQPNNPYHHGGKWTHTQVLKVLTDEKPSISCPNDTVVSAGGQCQGAYVNLPPATGMGACDVDVKITNNSPYADSSGPDASGFYPLGTTMVKFTAEDLCGNKKTCKTLVTVKDLKKPTPVCLHGVSSTLSLMKDGYYLDLQPKFFNKGSYDNCTPNHQLDFEVFPKRLDCDDLGENEVKLVVIDASGNSSFCTTYIDLQDNMDMCPPDTSTITLSGAVVNLSGDPMSGVQVIDTATGHQTATDEQGYFDISIYGNNTVHLTPFEMQSGLQGVTVYDLLLMQMHILGTYDFQDPVAALSADVNGNDVVSVSDIAQLKLQLLGNDNDMPMGYYGFVLVKDLSSEMIEEGLQQARRWLEEDMVDEDTSNTAYFVGFPYGDIDASSTNAWTPTNLEDRSGTDYPVSIRYRDDRIEFTAGQNITSRGMQMQIQLPGTGWSEDDIRNGVIPVEGSFSLKRDRNNTVLTIAMPLQKDHTIAKGDPLFSISGNGTADLVNQLKLNHSGSEYRLNAEMYSDELMIHDIEWRREGEDVTSTSLKIYPNPFNEQISVDYYMSEKESDITITVSNMTGTVVHQKELTGQKGWNEYRIEASEQWTSGMYLIRLNSSEDEMQTRVIKTE